MPRTVLSCPFYGVPLMDDREPDYADIGITVMLLVTLDMPEQVYLRAAGLRPQYGLRTPDALHVACAEHLRCDELWTNDDRLAQAAPALARRIG